MIDAKAAMGAAAAALRRGPAADDPDFAAWPGLAAGRPVAVADLAGAPAYWVAPLVARGVVVGFARVGADGGVAAIGLTCRTPEAPGTCPTPVFAMAPEAVAAAVAAATPLGPGEALSAPRLVHDGPPGREAWRSVLCRDGRPHRWIFTVPGGRYERAAGDRGDGTAREGRGP